MATKRRRDFQFEPLTMTWAEVADAVFYRTESWLRSNLPADFPRPDPAYDLFHCEAVETWARRRWGLTAAATDKPEDVTERLIARLSPTSAPQPAPVRNGMPAGQAVPAARRSSRRSAGT